jgi:methylmalonyl-CoA mutase cobalamin-binding subunit
VPQLLQMGVARVFGPGTPISDIAEFLHARGSQTGA